MLVISSFKKNAEPVQGGGDVRVTLKCSRAGQTLPTNSDYVLASQCVIKLVKAKSTMNAEPAYAAASSGAARDASAAIPAAEEAAASGASAAAIAATSRLGGQPEAPDAASDDKASTAAAAASAAEAAEAAGATEQEVGKSPVQAMALSPSAAAVDPLPIPLPTLLTAGALTADQAVGGTAVLAMEYRDGFVLVAAVLEMGGSGRYPVWFVTCPVGGPWPDQHAH